MAVFVEWQNANEQRNYPIHDRASRIASNGETLPNNLITDANVRFPESAGIAVMISGVGITSRLVTVTLSACAVHPFMDGGSTSGSFSVPLAAIGVRLPIDVGRLYPLDAIFPGVSGWISFGSGVASTQGFWNFLDPESGVLQERCMIPVRGVPVETLTKEGAAATICGLVRLKGTPGAIRTYKAIRTILVDGVERTVEAGIIALDFGEDRVSRMQGLAGACSGRPDVQTCGVRPLEAINGVKPDASGDVQLIFRGAAAVGDVGEGMTVDYPVSLADVCPVGFDPSILFPPPGPPTPPEPSTSSSSAAPLPSSSGHAVGPEYCEDFQDEASLELSVVLGSFSIETVGESSSSSSGGSESFFAENRYVSGAGTLTPQFSVDFDRELDASSAPYTVKATIRPRSIDGNGFLIAGYDESDSFAFVGLSLRDGGKFFVGRKALSGGSWPNGLGFGYPFVIPIVRNYPMPITDYRVVWLVEDENGGTVRFVWNDGTAERTQQVSFTWPPDTFNAAGRAGLGAVGSETEFGDFGINCGGSSSSGF